MGHGAQLARERLAVVAAPQVDGRPDVEHFAARTPEQVHTWAMRQPVGQVAVAAGIPVPALGSSLAYYDSYRSARLPANLTQGQRDFFGAHTYRRIDRDGDPDVLYSNGDAFDYAPPKGRVWNGVQWLENKGNGYFKYHRIGDLGGAYSPVALDLDSDGDMDVLALSSFNDWSNPKADSLMLYRNDGRGNFSPVILAHEPIQLLTLDAGDFDGSGRPGEAADVAIDSGIITDTGRVEDGAEGWAAGR